VGEVHTSQLQFSEEVREYCVGNTCRQYAKTWACPPAVGSVEECKERALLFGRMLVFSTVYIVEDTFDFEGYHNALLSFKEVVDVIHEKIRPMLSDYILLSNEGCARCKTCTYPEAPCRFPEKLCASLEGYGIFVARLAEQAGMKYNNGTNSVTYFGGLLYNDVIEGSSGL